MKRGRKPAGAKLVDDLPGSAVARTRLRKILETVSCDLTIEEACRELQISRTRFFDLRRSLLGSMIKELEPRPAGRPRREPAVSAEVEALQKKIQRLEIELKATQIRADLNAFLPLMRPKKRK